MDVVVVAFVEVVLPADFVDVELAVELPAPPAPPKLSALPVAQPPDAPIARSTLATPSAARPT